MAKAIEQSLAVNKGNPNYGANYEPLNPEQRKREENTPCGLQNIGNSKNMNVNHYFLACYFNSLLQFYYTIPGFVTEIMQAKIDEADFAALAKEEEKKEDDRRDVIEKQIEKRIRASKKLILEMKKLFANLAKSDKKYADPSGVLHSIVDEFGSPI